jgi:transaldolase
MLQPVGTAADTLRLATDWQAALAGGDWDLWIKLLPTTEALKCIAPLRQRGLRVLVTAVFTESQALLALAANADGIAVYLGRMQRLDPDWRSRLDRIAPMVREQDRMLLLASLPTRATVDEATRWSRDLTVAPAVFPDLLRADLTTAAIGDFERRVR